jgi:general secretion pathway protein D
MFGDERFSGFCQKASWGGQPRYLSPGRLTVVLIFILGVFWGGSFLVAAEQKVASGPPRYRVFSLRQISAEKGQGYLAEAGIGTVSVLPSPRTLLVTAKSEDLIKATALLKVVDSEQDYVIKGIFPASEASSWPSNEKIEAEVGRISIGTFLEPPSGSAERRAIIDIHDEMVVAIAPAELAEQIVSAIARLQEGGLDAVGVEEPVRVETDQERQAVHRTPDGGADEVGLERGVGEPGEAEVDSDELFGKLLKSLTEAEEREAREMREAAELMAEAAQPAVKEPVEPEAGREVRGRRRERGPRRERPVEEVVIEPNEPEMEEVLEAGPKAWSYEPEQIDTGEEMLELDLPETLDIVALLDLVGKYLHLDYMYDPTKVKGEVTLKLQGPIKVKDLYPLLESVLKFKDFVMTRKGNLVTIVPSPEVLNIDPALLRTEEDKVKVGDVIVTRVFELEYIDPASAKNLLTNMKLSADISAIEETGTLIVTAYAYRMSRVEELLAMVDKPGTPKQFRFRQLQYTMAGTLAPKLKTLAEQLGTVSISIAARPTPTPAPPSRGRTPPTRRTPTPTPGAAGPEPSVYLDADERTNRILMIGYEDQLEVVEGLIDTLDVAQQDLRALRLYDIQHVGAEEVRDKLVELGIMGAGTARPGAPSPAAKGQPSKAPAPAPAPGRITGEVLVEEPQVVIIESTNSLLVNATAEQHLQIATIIGYVDSETLEQAIPYRIYGLENQKPEDLATVLQKLIQETVEDKEGKIQKTIKKIEEDIVIVPDDNTFSLIVYASKKNQEWIGNLVEQLDKRRPQVLIDVSLVEITREDLFQYDLDLITNMRNAVLDNVALGTTNLVLGAADNFEAVWNVGQDGKVKGFYASDNIQALLTAVESKDYGRILAKPKILVNDNEEGKIITTERTFVKEETVSFPGDPPTQVTTVTFTPYEAKIELAITPNISEGDLLRLEINMLREDFEKKVDVPPDYTTSNINTIVTVPDGSTIILGGLTKLKQKKIGEKVPFFGDIPLVGGLFRTIDNSDKANKLYVFVKATILRPDETAGLAQLQRVSERDKVEFEKSERVFQEYEQWPGIKPEPMDPLHVLEEQ